VSQKPEIFVKSINKVIFVMACPKSFQLVNTSTKIPNILVKVEKITVFLILNFRRVLNIVCILLGISPASDCDLPKFRNLLSVPSSKAGCGVLHTQPLKMELTEGSETSENHNLTPGKYPKEYIQNHSNHIDSINSRYILRIKRNSHKSEEENNPNETTV
jgi:hypothetical protein